MLFIFDNILSISIVNLIKLRFPNVYQHGYLQIIDWELE